MKTILTKVIQTSRIIESEVEVPQELVSEYNSLTFWNEEEESEAREARIKEIEAMFDYLLVCPMYDETQNQTGYSVGEDNGGYFEHC